MGRRWWRVLGRDHADFASRRRVVGLAVAFGAFAGGLAVICFACFTGEAGEAFAATDLTRADFSGLTNLLDLAGALAAALLVVTLAGLDAFGEVGTAFALVVVVFTAAFFAGFAGVACAIVPAFGLAVFTRAVFFAVGVVALAANFVVAAAARLAVFTVFAGFAGVTFAAGFFSEAGRAFSVFADFATIPAALGFIGFVVAVVVLAAVVLAVVVLAAPGFVVVVVVVFAVLTALAAARWTSGDLAAVAGEALRAFGFAGAAWLSSAPFTRLTRSAITGAAAFLAAPAVSVVSATAGPGVTWARLGFAGESTATGAAGVSATFASAGLRALAFAGDLADGGSACCAGIACFLRRGRCVGRGASYSSSSGLGMTRSSSPIPSRK